MRLHQGDFDAETIYDDDPVRVARRVRGRGREWIHVVDLDAARTGERAHLDQIRLIVRSVACRVEVGGGVRTAEAACELLDAGVRTGGGGHRGGRAAGAGRGAVRRLPGPYRGRARRPWQRGGDPGLGRGFGRRPRDLARRFDGIGLAALIVTEIGRDGTLEGPAFGQLSAVLEESRVPLVASGGVGTLDDLRALARLRAGDRGLAGVIVGRALYEGRFGVAEALASLAEAMAD